MAEAWVQNGTLGAANSLLHIFLVRDDVTEWNVLCDT